MKENSVNAINTKSIKDIIIGDKQNNLTISVNNQFCFRMEWMANTSFLWDDNASKLPMLQ